MTDALQRIGNIGTSIGGSISLIAGAANRIGNLFGLGGGNGSRPPELKLGDVTFHNTEIPEAIPLGGEQSVNVHELPGGARVVDNMGYRWQPVGWSGLLLGANAWNRGAALLKMMQAGKPYVISFYSFRHNCIITSYQMNVEATYRIAYSIQVLILEQNYVPAPGNADAAIQADAAAASGLAGLTGLSGIISTVSSAVATVQTINSFAKAAISDVKTALNVIKIARDSVHSAVNSIESTMRTLTSLGGVASNASITSNKTGLAAHVTNTRNAAALHQLDATLSRMQTNINLAAGLGGPGNSQRTVTVIGGNLMTLAQKYYSDATQWQKIATANRLTDPMISGQQTLIIPPLN